jgi:hypothetical protein
MLVHEAIWLTYSSRDVISSEEEEGQPLQQTSPFVRYKKTRLDRQLILPLKVCPHATKFLVCARRRLDVVYGVHRDIAQHHTGGGGCPAGAR